jgi:hypothetical protein
MPWGTVLRVAEIRNIGFVERMQLRLSWTPPRAPPWRDVDGLLNIPHLLLRHLCQVGVGLSIAVYTSDPGA